MQYQLVSGSSTVEGTAVFRRKTQATTVDKRMGDKTHQHVGNFPTSLLANTLIWVMFA